MKHLFRHINFVNILALVVVLGCFAYFFYISSSVFPAVLIKEISDVKIAFITFISTVLAFYFGASKKESNNQTDNTNPKTTMKYFAITTTSQNITAFNGLPVSKTIAQWVADNPSWSIYDDNDPDYYPSLVATNDANTATFSTDGALSAQLIAGSHPPRRPK